MTAQDRQHGLFAISHLVGASHGLVGQEAQAIRHTQAPGVGFALVGRNNELFVQLGVAQEVVHIVLGECIRESKADLAGLFLLSAVGDLHGELQLVSLTQETWRVGLHHDVLGGDSATTEESATQFVVVGETHEFPLGESLWHIEFQTDFAVFIGNQMWHEEGSLL